jgi:DNA topoisomerase I
MMAKNLVVVESPAKAKTVNRYLGPDYLVEASMGHIRDLPKSTLGIDIDDGFHPRYKILPKRKALVSKLQKEAEKSDSVLLAADPDREGEAICWHLSEVLKEYNLNIHRVLFHEITKKAVQEAFEYQHDLDEDKINAQQTRRILDRLVGYRISPLLWKKIGRGLSAGRVQSVALRLICEREREIQDFVQEEYWTITVLLRASNPPPFTARLEKAHGKKIKIKDEKSARKIEGELKNLDFILHDLKIKQKEKNPQPPYITSALQQDSFRLNRFSVKKTMTLAQKLYEGLEIGGRGLVGLITYMRTDSFRVSGEAVKKAREQIGVRYGKEFVPKSFRGYKNKKKTQDAHEAIRPTSVELTPEKIKPFLSRDLYKLYTMIWNRFMASQMSSARIEATDLNIRAGDYQFAAKGEVIKFPGFLAVYSGASRLSSEKEKILPRVKKGEKLKLKELEPKQNFTQPPPRYTEGSLVKELEAKGIGRPSTYAPILATLQNRAYVLREKGRFVPTEVGLYVNDYLVENFPDLLEFKFTAKLEESLDRISEGEKDWQEYLKSYNALLDEDLQAAEKKEGIKKQGIPTEETCPKCGKKLVIKSGRYGKFVACSGYPECDYKKSLDKKEPKPLDESCPECGSQLVMRHGRYGNFIACSNYPECKYIKKETKETGIQCPECSGTLVKRKTRRGKIFTGCSNYPQCKFASWDEPVERVCPECGRHFLLKKSPAGEKPFLYCSNKECSFKQTLDEENSEAPAEGREES